MATTEGNEGALGQVRHAIETARPGFGTFFLARFLGLTISYDDHHQTCVVELPYAPYLCNPQGSVHGGILSTVMDISMGHLCHRFLSTAVTIEMQTRFFRPLTGAGRCEGQLLRSGRRIVHLQSRMHDEQGRLVALATGSWHRLQPAEPDSHSVSAHPAATPI